MEEINRFCGLVKYIAVCLMQVKNHIETMLPAPFDA